MRAAAGPGAAGGGRVVGDGREAEHGRTPGRTVCGRVVREGRVLQNGLWGAAEGEVRLAPDHAEIARRLLGR